MRSFDRAMPEEVNGVMTDHVSARPAVPVADAVATSVASTPQGVEMVGDGGSSRPDVAPRAASDLDV